MAVNQASKYVNTMKVLCYDYCQGRGNGGIEKARARSEDLNKRDHAHSMVRQINSMIQTL